MAISQHTPGPYHYEALPGVITAKARQQVASITPPHLGVFDTDGEREATGRLLAAAPDLLEAMKGCLVDMEIFYSRHREPDNKYFAAFKAAIEKAEGSADA